MEHTETLTILAEVAIVIAGFAGVVSVFRFGRHEDEGQNKSERWMLLTLIFTGVEIAAFALLPLVLNGYSIDEVQIWSISSVVLALAYILTDFVLLRWREKIPEQFRPITSFSDRVIWMGDMILITLLLANVWIESPGIYLTALFYWILQGMYIYFLMFYETE